MVILREVLSQPKIQTLTRRKTLLNHKTTRRTDMWFASKHYRRDDKQNYGRADLT